MKTILVCQVCNLLDYEIKDILRQAYIYAEAELPTKQEARKLARDVLYENDFNNEVVENYVIDVLANRARPIKPKLIELRKAE